jgi:predicted membrane protein
MSDPTNVHHQFHFEIGQRKGLPMRFWFGVILLMLGVGFLLNVFHILPFGEFIGVYWPSLLMFVALVQLVTRSASFKWSAILFAVGALLQMEHLGWIDSIWSVFWPVVLIIIGLSMVFNLDRKKKVEIFTNPMTASGASSSNSDTLEQSSVFSSNNVRSSSRAFRGGHLSTVFGSMEVDLRDCEIDGTEATLDCEVIFGNTEIFVPPHWRVVVTGSPFLGNIDNRAQTLVDTGVIGPTLVIRAQVVLSNLEIRV